MSEFFFKYARRLQPHTQVACHSLQRRTYSNQCERTQKKCPETAIVLVLFSAGEEAWGLDLVSLLPPKENKSKVGPSPCASSPTWIQEVFRAIAIAAGEWTKVLFPLNSGGNPHASSLPLPTSLTFHYLGLEQGHSAVLQEILEQVTNEVGVPERGREAWWGLWEEGYKKSLGFARTWI